MNLKYQKNMRRTKNLLTRSIALLLLLIVVISLNSCLTPRFVYKNFSFNYQSIFDDLKLNVDLDKSTDLLVKNDPLYNLYFQSKGVKRWKKYFKNRQSGQRQIEVLKKRLPILNFLRKKMRESDLPEELAFIAFVESFLNTKAKSHMKALGMWQFMSYTGRNYGLNINWSTDDRLNMYLSTDAAIKYFKYLYSYLKDWQLVVLAYNYGEYGTKRIIKRFGYTKGFSKFPRESREFLLKIKALIQLYNDKLPKDTEFGKGYTIIKIKGKWSISELSKKLKIDINTLKKLNPQFKINYAISNVNNLIIPISKYYLAQKIKDNNGNIHKMIVVKVKKGDTIYGISRKFKIGYITLMKINAIKNPRRVRPGKRIYIPIKRRFM
ncbi:transglycosylase SLT domain-containing protein [bacterium]|nr:transglycosylase SLT domain-containing protein [bacterium]